MEEIGILSSEPDGIEEYPLWEQVLEQEIQGIYDND